MKALTLALAASLLVLALPMVAAQPVDTPPCYEVYTRYDVGTYSIVRRNSCAAPEFYQCPYQGAPISSCRGLLE